MQNKLNCNQVITLLTFYIENKLDRDLSKCVQEHLNICPHCMEKYMKLRRILENFQEIKTKITEEEEDTEQYNNPQYQRFKANLSAYIDNELSDNENLKIKKIAISNPLARKDLEDFYSFKQLLNSSFNRTKNELKYDFSKKTLEQIRSDRNKKRINPFYKIAGIFTAALIVVIGLINMLNF
ncbi:zf-HC2 domain-containing protein [Spirochaetes bacterium]|uniref:Zf-HC2 domain-containing protein n=1 Tax=Candidatus Scatousia excrementipullorum TaxID=2840936 RepID=A0A9D9H023_9BACT|nr:zf-HC2 domain-containing protein [Candidatus Scatousia excrementipullorum]